MKPQTWTQIRAAILVATTVVGVAITVEAQGVSSGRLFECSVKQVVALRDDGSIGSTPWTKSLSKIDRFSRFTFDEARGAFRWSGDDKVWTYDVRQHGTDQNSLVALRTYQGPAAFVLATLEINAFNDGAEGFPFLLNSAEVYSGFCQAR